MTDIVIPPGMKGVQYTAPPEDMIPHITGRIQQAIDAIGTADMALFGVADGKGGMNGAVVVNGPKGVKVLAWIGKEWAKDSDVDWGVMALKTWTFDKK